MGEFDPMRALITALVFVNGYPMTVANTPLADTPSHIVGYCLVAAFYGYTEGCR